MVRIGTGQIKGVSPFLKGLALLDRIGDFNILCIPQTEHLSDTHAAKVMQAAIALVVKHRAIYFLDVPQRDAPRHTDGTLATWVNYQSGIRHSHVAYSASPSPTVPTEINTSHHPRERCHGWCIGQN